MRAQDAYIFLAILIGSEVHGAERATADFLLNHILVDPQLRGAVIFAVGVL